MANDLTFQDGNATLDSSLRPIKVDDKASSIEISETGNGARVAGDLEITGTVNVLDVNRIHRLDEGDLLIRADGGDIYFEADGFDIHFTDTITLTDGQLGTASLTFRSLVDLDDYFKIATSTNGATTITTVDAVGKSADLLLSVDGYISVASASNEVISISSGGDINLTPGTDDDVNIPADKGLTFGNDGEKIEGDGTDLTISASNDLTLDVANDVIIDGANSILFHDSGNKYGGFTSATSSGMTISNGGGGVFHIDSGGSVTLDSHSGEFIAKKAGTEFSAANSSYAGMILGYTRLQGDLTSQNSYEIQNAFTVEDDTHQITFKTPPSELVEIEATFAINRVTSLDTKICIGLSDQSATETYNSLGVEYEYDSLGISMSDDETDDGVYVVKWTVIADDLEAIGSSNTLYIGFSTGGSTKTAYIAYGVRASHGICDHPFVIKATALPIAIYDGQ